jgi:hypothetical protein
MALSQSALSELLDAFRAGDGVDLIRESVPVVLQELIEAEATEVIGADRYQRTDTRVTDRNGSRPRLLTTKAGDVALSIPKLRARSFFPSVLEPRRRIDQALYAVVMGPTCTGSRPARSMTWWSRWAGRGSPRARSRASAPASMRWSARSGPGAWTTPGSRVRVRPHVEVGVWADV